MIRATHGVHSGGYFWEAMILPSSHSEAHFRIGWSTRQGELQAPVGYDAYSYAYRDVSGTPRRFPNFFRRYLSHHSLSISR